MKLLKTLLASLALLAGTHAPAFAFPGFYAGKSEGRLLNASSQVVLVRDGKRTVLTLQSDYQGPLQEFALVVPTPTPLKPGQVRLLDPAWFEQLELQTSARLEVRYDADPCYARLPWGEDAFKSMDAGGSSGESMGRYDYWSPDKVMGITVESHYSLGEYDIVHLSATQSEGLETWLQQNGYRVPPGASAALKPYIRQGMGFFVAKVNLRALANTGYSKLRPLQFAYESDTFMLPLRLGLLNAPPDRMQDLVLYAITRNGRVESSNYPTLKMPTHAKLPYFVTSRFGNFYKDMFDRQVQKSSGTVFTEYFWNNVFCNDCTGRLLDQNALLNYGAFWAYGHDDANFEALRTPGGRLRGYQEGDRLQDLKFPAVTRLHLRYSANTFPEDLVLVETRDTQPWQARYVAPQPTEGSVAACGVQMAQLDCQSKCTDKVDYLFLVNRPKDLQQAYRDKPRATLQSECLHACVASKKTVLDRATRYYTKELPSRLESQVQTLSDLSGWSRARIEAMARAR
jgi:hypothetical protein